MSDNIISYIEMCRREGTSLQQGMNFGIVGNHSVILMSVRWNAPYRDRLEDGGTTLVYEGHVTHRTNKGEPENHLKFNEWLRVIYTYPTGTEVRPIKRIIL